MRCLILILPLLLLAGSANAESASARLVAADKSPLKRVPDTSVYRPSWSGFQTPAPILQASYTESTAAAGGGSQNASASELPVADSVKPYFDLNMDMAEAAQADAEVSDTSGLFTKLAVWTVIILCLCVLTVLGLRRWQKNQGLIPEHVGQARVLETLAIGPGRAISLIQLGDVRAVVGTDGSGIKTIVLAPPAFEDELGEFDDNEDDSLAAA
jgi:flagellar biogenesis protein FliO